MVHVEIPGSKSITARALFLAAAAAGPTTLVAPLRSDDTEAFTEGLQRLGYQVDLTPQAWTITGQPQWPGADGASVFCRDGATTARFLPALAACGKGTVEFDASEQMRRRPMAPLTKALQQLGVSLDFHGEPDHHPFTLTTSGIPGGHLTLDAGTSSQFLTALLLLAPLTKDGLQIDVTDLVSVPYVEMTIAMMASFGVTVEVSNRSYRVAPQPYIARTYPIEPDASSASYFFATAALLGETITVPRLGSSSLQGDLGFVDVLARMGATVSKDEHATTVTGNGQLHGITVNMRDISDTMPTLAAIAPFADGPTRIIDVYNTRVKECDRLEACATNLRALGIQVETGRDWIEIWPGEPVPAQITCYGDHRIAMAFSVTGLRTPGITLDDPGCVKKTFPQFHPALAALVDELRSPA
ncbi:3-phosphoshikimate 1-carboxyvinyltransferase [Kineosporia sp. NBRC 101731]|uniref:3-phosphoshikimate 1-carboxyvinyltransferase n=1 Tax=Kineosporia sp. NBRC 101731 TaxID=3032199 RepID=UPI0024A05627|nr:3-phosphoshikimate 1-carboxyvinyltransferase [Kineosporia sp. NBRC 101731]GLY31949.1 3-phosphoshikimate 1-carboxyvinyltransferase [Kineosporia sp. NBRC 101731]